MSSSDDESSSPDISEYYSWCHICNDYRKHTFECGEENCDLQICKYCHHPCRCGKYLCGSCTCTYLGLCGECHEKEQETSSSDDDDNDDDDDDETTNLVEDDRSDDNEEELQENEDF